MAESRSQSRWRLFASNYHWLCRRILFVLLAVVLAGPLYQQLVQTVDAQRLTPPGRLVDIGNATLHIHCTGTGSPTVVLEAGATGFAQSWFWVQQSLSRQTRVCSYDRAGLGWSERAPHVSEKNTNKGTDGISYTGLETAQNLKELLIKAHEPGPYVMVGHSMGGPLVQIFTGLYPQEVVGVGLVDPSHPEQLERYQTKARPAMEQFLDSLRLASTLTHVGVVRLTNILARNAQGLPDQVYDTAKFFAASPVHLTTSYRELEQWETTMDVARDHLELGKRPLLVISATQARADFPPDFVDAFQKLHRELASASSESRHIKIAGADHFTLLTGRQYAQRTAQALHQLVQQVRHTSAQAADLADAEKL